MASRVAEVIYRLKDLFSGPTKRVTAGYRKIRSESRKTADQVERDGRRQSRGLNAVAAGVGALAGRWRGLAAAASTLAITQQFKSIVDEADRIGKAADKINLTSEALSRLAFAASRENVDFRQLEIGLQRMQRRIGDAINGSTELQKTFAALGLDINELSKLSADQAFLQIADAIRGVGDETQQLSLFIKIFDAEAADLIRLAKQGSGAIKGLGDEAERLGRVFGGDVTQNAARFNDALTGLEARLTGIKVGAFTEPLEQVVEFFDNVGLGDEVKGLTAQMLLLEQRLEKPIQLFGRRKALERELEGIRSRLRILNRERRTAEAASQSEAAAAAASAAEYARVETALDSLNTTQRARIAALKDTLRAETAEREAALRAQQRIAEEFAQLRASISAPDGEDVFLADVSLKQRQAAAALRDAVSGDGSFETAIALAREGGDLLGQLKEKGTESQAVLAFFAKQLEKVAIAAAGQRTEEEILDAEKIAQQVQLAEGHLAHLTETMKTEGGKAGQAFVDEMARVMRETTLPAPAVAPPVLPLPEVVREGIQIYRDTLSRQGGR